MTGTWTAVAVLLVGFSGTSTADLAAQEIVFPAADWEEATPASQGVDPEKLAAAVNYLRKNSGRDGVQELVIIRHGRMIWKGGEIDNVHGVWSCTKSVGSGRR